MYQFSVPELSEPGAVVGHVRALDADIGPNAEMDYTVVGGDGLDVFSITANKTTQYGIISVKKVKLVSFPTCCVCSPDYRLIRRIRAVK